MDIPARYAEMARGTRAFAALNAARESDRMSHAYLLASPDPAIEKPVDPKKIFFTSSDNARCSRFCLPGDTLDIELKVSRIRHPLFFFEGRSFVGGERASFVEKITLTFDYKS